MKYSIVAKLRTGLTAVIVMVLYMLSALSVTHAASPYGKGLYGRCEYNSCGISITSGSAVNLDIVPTMDPTCSVQQDTVAVTTNSSTGYTLTLNDYDTLTQLVASNGNTINTVNATGTAPVRLNANTWGFRVDGTNGFGAGPTSAVTNAGVPTVGFAAIPSSAATAETLASSTVAAYPAVNTTVWYGLCVNASLPSGAYSDSVVYTAVVN